MNLVNRNRRISLQGPAKGWHQQQRLIHRNASVDETILL